MFTQTVLAAPATILAATSLAGLVIVVFAALKGWQGWLDLKARELDARREPGAPPNGAARIEMADLRERVRKLEAIANGVDL